MLSSSFTLPLAAVSILLYAVFKFIVYPVFLSPLSKIPNAHPTASISSFWILRARHQFRENKTIHAAHVKHGDVVRLGPNEVSVNCVENGLRAVYAGGYEKHDWYPNLFPNYDGVPNMFSTAQSRPHSVRKRMLSNVYSKSYLQSSTTLSLISRHLIHRRLFPHLQRAIDTNTTTKGSDPKADPNRASAEVEVHNLFNTITMDFVTAYIFGLGNGTNFIEDSTTADWWLELYQSRKKFTFWPQELPSIAAAAAKLGLDLSPRWVASANRDLETWCLTLCDAAAATTKHMDDGAPVPPQDVPVVYRQLQAALAAECAKKSTPDTPMTPADAARRRLALASELLDELSAGEETSAITLTYLFHELCLHKGLQERLRAEVRTLDPPLHGDSHTPPGASPGAHEADPPLPRLPSPRELDALPLLHGVLMETLRLHAAIPGPQPRVTPSVPGGVTLGRFAGISAGVRVSSQAYSLHRNARVFPRPEDFVPERWMPAGAAGGDLAGGVRRVKGGEAAAVPQAEMSRWFWAFSSGGRMCIGSNLAMQEMKLVVAALVARYRFSVVDDSGIEQEDAYTAQPVGRRLVLAVEKL